MSGTAAPIIAIGGSASGGGDASVVNDAIGSIAADYAQLIAAGPELWNQIGAKIFDMDAGTISWASPAQIGRVINGVTITADIVEENQTLLNAIGRFCRENGISIQVEAQLDNPPAADWTYQWLVPAVTAGLPIIGVENANEVALQTTDFATRAQNMIAIVQQIVLHYPNVNIGQWEAGAPVSTITEWWSAYNSAAKAAGLPTIGYVTADTSWNAPWVTSPANWEGWLRDLSQAAQAEGMQLKVLLDGINTDASNQQWVAQSEQHAQMLADLGIPVAELLVKSWQLGYPNAVLPLNAPGTLGNAAAEIAALYPLYNAGSITAQGPATVATPAQLILSSNAPTDFHSLAISLDQADIGAGTRIAVVLADQTGELSVQPSVAVSNGNGTNKLVLNGTVAEINAALQTFQVTGSVPGPDSLDIEVFGANGRLSTTQVALLSLPSAPAGNNQTFNFAPSSTFQYWTGASASINSSGTITSEILYWNSTDKDSATGSYQVIHAVAIHEPVAQQGVVIVNNVLQNTQANPPPNSEYSLPLGLSNYVPMPFNPANELSTINVLSTTLSYSISSGKLQTVVESLAPTNPTANLGNYFSNYFSNGGIQITQYNTGDNPEWQSNWDWRLASVTTTYGSQDQILEQVFQGGPDEPYFLLDNIFNPYDGSLWEQIETAPPLGPYSYFVTGLKYVTEFNTGDNPNWDYTDWGNAPQVTVVWQDYYVTAVTRDAPVRTGLRNTDAYTIDTVICFAKGTRIRTPEGDVNVEALRPGQMVLTARGVAKPVKWIGHRAVNCRHHPNPTKVWPIRFRAHAFGRSLPARDLLVSPQHALFDEGVLIPAKYLVNDHNVIQEPVNSIEYYHVELEQHDLLLAEGMPAESYLDSGDRGNFDNCVGPVNLHPDFGLLRWDGSGCAELKVVGPEVDAVRAKLAKRKARRVA